MGRLALLALFVTAVSFACASPRPQEAAPTAAAVSPAVYVAKVKNVLVGLPPTDGEVGAVTRDAAALGGLVDGWMQRPEYARKMMRFFELALQQAQVQANDYADQVHGQPALNAAITPRLLQNLQESFARTMLELIARGRPLSDAMTTHQVMMTTALEELYAFLDTVEIDDDSNTFDHFRQQYRTVQIVAEAAQGPIPIEETLDPASPNYMHWFDPDVASAGADTPGCQQDPVLLPSNAITLHWLLLGSLDGRTLATGAHCPVFAGTPGAPQLSLDDFRDWRMVTLRPPNPGEDTTTFFDLPRLRTAHELVQRTPRVGFFSTPAFLANWPTNVSNQARVTAHQALIVATGSSVDGTDATVVASAPGLDAAHADQAECVGCHRILDPTRSIFSATWSWNYHRQQDPAWSSQPGIFAFRGVVQPVQDLDDFGRALARHPRVAPGWVQKLCTYVDSAACDESDPEFQRLVTDFRDSGLAWNALVKAVVTSPLTTHAERAPVATVRREVVAVARRDHLCAALDARLGFSDVCGLDALSGDGASADIAPIVAGLPSDAYGRGAVMPILPTQPSLFFRAGIEHICERVAAQVVDAPGATAPAGVRRWSGAAADTAIDAFVSDVMALPLSDDRAAAAGRLLREHFQAALRTPGITATDALRSTFVVACQAPSTVSLGL